MKIWEYLRDNILLFDGAMGTYYASLYPEDGGILEFANLSHASRILQIHKEYLEAGAKAIKTNTFAANTQSLGSSFETVQDVIRAGWRIAAGTAGDAYVFADIGPMPEFDLDEYLAICDTFLSLGAEHFLFETFGGLEELPRIAAYIKEKNPEAFILVSFAAAPDGVTRQGQEVAFLLKTIDADPNFDGGGVNCVSGPSHLLGLAERLPERPGNFSVMPNAGYPTIVRGRTVFEGKAAYYGQMMGAIAAAGAKIVGGCCGTTPDYIRETALTICNVSTENMGHTKRAKTVRVRENRNRLAQRLQNGQRIIAVELDPPTAADVSRFMAGARALRDAGADAVTIADCPIARARVDSSLLAAKLRRELGIDPIPHMTCRDRNINATKALLLGLSVEEVSNVLVVTGDPIPSAQRDEVKGVFSFNSVVLADYISRLGNNGEVSPFRIWGALNVNAPNFTAELAKAQRKEEAGITGFLTQPCMTDAAFENLKKAHETLSAVILGGIMPIVSQRNALFMNNEIAGIDVPQNVIDRYEGLDRAQAEELATLLSVQFAERMRTITEGVYLITPFGRTELMERILRALPKD